MNVTHLLALVIGAGAVFLEISGSGFAEGPFQDRETSVSAPSVPDSLLYAELVRYVRENGLWKGPTRDHAFDRRFVRTVREPLGLTADDLITPSESRLRTNARVLQHLGVAETDILSDVGCALSGGLRAPEPEPGTVSPKSTRCKRKGQFVSVVFGRPRPTEDCSQSDTVGGPVVADRCVVVEAIEISQNSYYEYALAVAYISGRGWKVVDAIRVSGVSS